MSRAQQVKNCISKCSKHCRKKYPSKKRSRSKSPRRCGVDGDTGRCSFKGTKNYELCTKDRETKRCRYIKRKKKSNKKKSSEPKKKSSEPKKISIELKITRSPKPHATSSKPHATSSKPIDILNMSLREIDRNIAHNSWSQDVRNQFLIDLDTERQTVSKRLRKLNSDLKLAIEKNSSNINIIQREIEDAENKLTVLNQKIDIIDNDVDGVREDSFISDNDDVDADDEFANEIVKAIHQAINDKYPRLK